VSHGRGRSRAVPVLLVGSEPNHIAGPDFFDRPAPMLSAPAARRNDQGLAERVRVPCRPGARFKRDTGPTHARRFWRLKEWVDPHRTGKPVGRSWA